MNRRERFMARVQAALTLLLVVSFVALLLLWSFGLEAAGSAADKLKEFVSLGVIFWLMRHRQQNGEEADEPDPAKREKPPSTTSSPGV